MRVRVDYHIILDMDMSITKVTDFGNDLLDFLHVLVISPALREKHDFLVKKLMFSTEVPSKYRQFLPFNIWKSTHGNGHHGGTTANKQYEINKISSFRCLSQRS